MDDNQRPERSTYVQSAGERSMSDGIALLRQALPAVLPRLRRFARTLTRNVHDAVPAVGAGLRAIAVGPPPLNQAAL